MTTSQKIQSILAYSAAFLVSVIGLLLFFGQNFEYSITPVVITGLAALLSGTLGLGYIPKDVDGARQLNTWLVTQMITAMVAVSIASTYAFFAKPENVAWFASPYLETLSFGLFAFVSWISTALMLAIRFPNDPESKPKTKVKE